MHYTKTNGSKALCMRESNELSSDASICKLTQPPMDKSFIPADLDLDALNQDLVALDHDQLRLAVKPFFAFPEFKSQVPFLLIPSIPSSLLSFFSTQSNFISQCRAFQTFHGQFHQAWKQI